MWLVTAKSPMLSMLSTDSEFVVSNIEVQEFIFSQVPVAMATAQAQVSSDPVALAKIVHVKASG